MKKTYRHVTYFREVFPINKDILGDLDSAQAEQLFMEMEWKVSKKWDFQIVKVVPVKRTLTDDFDMVQDVKYSLRVTVELTPWDD